MRAQSAGLLIIFFLLSACSGRNGHAFRTYLEEGVPITETTGGSQYTDPLFTFEEILRLEQDESRPETLYSDPTGFMMGPEGDYFVLDRRSSMILKYNAQGTYTGSFGGRGEGPGEFMMPELEAIEGDTLILYDQSQMRLTRFRTDGTLLDIIPTQAYSWVPFILPISGDRFVVNTGDTENRGDFMYRASLLLIVNASGKDTTCSLSTSLVQNSFVTRSGSAWSASSLPYVAWPSMQYFPGRGILAADGDRPELAWYDLEGSIQSIIRLGMDDRLMTVEIKNEYRRLLQQRRDELAALRGQPSRPIDEVHFPEKGGYWGQIMVDDAGYLWLQDVMSNPTWIPSEPWLHHVVSPEGRYLGSVELPCRTGVITDGKLLAIVTDPETDEEWAVVYQIKSAVPGLEYP